MEERGANVEDKSSRTTRGGRDGEIRAPIELILALAPFSRLSLLPVFGLLCYYWDYPSHSLLANIVTATESESLGLRLLDPSCLCDFPSESLLKALRTLMRTSTVLGEDEWQWSDLRERVPLAFPSYLYHKGQVP